MEQKYLEIEIVRHLKIRYLTENLTKLANMEGKKKSSNIKN